MTLSKILFKIFVLILRTERTTRDYFCDFRDVCERHTIKVKSEESVELGGRS